MATTLNRAHHNQRVFLSVFSPPDHTTPTPKATPVVGTLSSPGQPFGGFINTQRDHPIDDAARSARAWSTATRFLTPAAGLELPNDSQADIADFRQALDVLLQNLSSLNELLAWHRREASAHFRRYVLPQLDFWKRAVALSEASQFLSRTVSILERAMSVYLRFSDAKLGLHGSQYDAFKHRIRSDIHALILHSLPSVAVQKALSYQLYQTMVTRTELNSDPARCTKENRCSCRPLFDLDMLRRYEHVGLGGELGERAFAMAVHRYLSGPGIERRCFAVDWVGHQTVIPRLRCWVQDCLRPAIQRAMAVLTATETTEVDLDQLTHISILNLGTQRVEAAYDYIRTWPDSQGALLDIKEYLEVGGITTKAHLCESFSKQIKQRLLHTGASTTEILGVYVNAIHAMKLLDPRGVLLERVAIPVRNYLRTREDTANIIARSFLAKIDDQGNVITSDDEESIVCPDITRELANCALNTHDTKALNWSDMEWVPDPIDAGPDYRSSKSDDVVAHIFGLFGHDDLIKAVTSTFGDHLRHTTDTELITETKLVELLKTRLDNSKLQAIEVMLKDVRESVLLNRRANPEQHRATFLSEPDSKEIAAAIPEDGITLQGLYSIFKSRMSLSKFTASVKVVAQKRNDLYYAKRTRGNVATMQSDETDQIQFDAKVLSGQFWPLDFESTETKATVNIPSIDARKRSYNDAFASISGQRKLEWAPDWDTMDIELELEDRTLHINGVLAWRWAVLEAFNDPTPTSDDFADETTEEPNPNPDGNSAATIASRLSMDEDQVLNAIAYWISQDVLFQRTPGHYAILERKDIDLDLDTDGGAEESLVQINMDDVQFRKAVPMIEVFIRNMLGASGARAIAGPMGITGMLTMMMPGFEYGDEEVLKVLSEMKERGETAVEGEVWRVV